MHRAAPALFLQLIVPAVSLQLTPRPLLSTLATAAREVAHHAFDAPPSRASFADVPNTNIPSGDGQRDIAAFVCNARDNTPAQPLLVVLHEFYGLSPSIAARAEALAGELGQ